MCSRSFVIYERVCCHRSKVYGRKNNNVKQYTSKRHIYFLSILCSSDLYAPPSWDRDTRDIAGLKCPDLTHDVSPQCRGCVEVFISRLNRPLRKSLSEGTLNIHLCICQYKPKGVQPGGFVGQFACSWAGADPEIILSGMGDAKAFY